MRGQYLLRILALLLLSGTPMARSEWIDAVEINGMEGFKQTEIEEQIELGPGEPFDDQRILRTKKNIETFLQFKGFEKNQVQVQQRKSTLLVVVRRGLPTRIRAVNLRFDRGGLLPELQSKVRSLLPEGQVFDRDQVVAIRSQIQELCRKQGYLGARLGEVTLSDVQANESHLKVEANRWVDLEWAVELGDRVRFSFRGNEAVTRQELLGIVDDQRTLGLSAQSADAVKDRILERYRLSGYLGTQIVSRSFQEEHGTMTHISYQIIEGERTRVRNIFWEGQIQLSESDLRKVVAESWFGLLDQGIFSEADLLKTADNLTERIRRMGFLTARINSTRKVLTPDLRLVDLTFNLKEGERTLVESLVIHGDGPLSAENLQKILKVSQGQPLDLLELNYGLERLKAAYRDLGYLDVQIPEEVTESVVRYSNALRRAEVEFSVVPGPLARYAGVEVQGLVVNFPEVVSREIAWTQGDILYQFEINDLEQRLRRISAFSEVRVQIERLNADGNSRVVVKVRENIPGAIGGGVGVRNDLGLRIFGDASYDQLWHRNHTLLLGATANRRFEEFRVLEFMIRAAYIYPHFLIDRLIFRPEISRQIRQFKTFDSDVTRGQLSFERVLSYRPNLTATFAYSLEDIREFDVPEQLGLEQVGLGNQTIRIGSISPGLQLDLRDSSLAPTRGFYSRVSLEYAAPWLGAQTLPYPVNYLQLQVRNDLHWTMFGILGSFSVRGGAIRNLINPNDYDETVRQIISIPRSKQFTLGGVSSLRGYEIQEINQQGLLIQGVSTFINYRLQVDFPLKGGLMLGPFLDAGGLYLNKFSLTELSWGTGVGVRYITPVGPVNFDLGFKLNREANEEPVNFYISVGVL